MYRLSSLLLAATPSDRGLYINPVDANNKNSKSITKMLQALSDDVARITSWCRSPQTVPAQKSALLSYAYAIKSWQMLAPCARTVKGKVSSCSNVPKQMALKLNRIFLSMVTGIEFLYNDGLFDQDMMDVSTLFGGRLSASQADHGNGLNRNRRLALGVVRSLMNLDNKLAVSSFEGTKRLTTLLTQLELPPAPSSKKLTGWVKVTPPPTPATTPMQRHVVPVDAPECSHVKCRMSWHGARMVMRVKHHHAERHGNHHYCAMNKGTGGCMCKCHGVEVSAPEAMKEPEEWLKPPSQEVAPPPEPSEDEKLKEACEANPVYSAKCDEHWTDAQWQAPWAEQAYCKWYPRDCKKHADLHETNCARDIVVKGCQVYWSTKDWRQNWNKFCQWFPAHTECVNQQKFVPKMLEAAAAARV